MQETWPDTWKWWAPNNYKHRNPDNPNNSPNISSDNNTNDNTQTLKFDPRKCVSQEYHLYILIRKNNLGRLLGDQANPTNILLFALEKKNEIAHSNQVTRCDLDRVIKDLKEMKKNRKKWHYDQYEVSNPLSLAI